MLLFVLSASFSIPAVSGAAPSSDRAFAPNAVLVRVAPGMDVRDVAQSHRLAEASAAGVADVYRLTIADGLTPPEKARELAQDGRVVYAEPDYIGQIPEAQQRSSWAVGNQDSTTYAAQWAPATLHLSQAHAVSRGAGVVVAVLDTGVDATHPALASHLVAGYDMIDTDADPSEATSASDNTAFGHGTHVAGVVALAAPDARIMPIRTLKSDGTGTIWNQVQGLRYAAEHGADVINLSWSFHTRSRALEDVIATVTCAGKSHAKCQDASNPGVVVVAAAGNTGADVAQYPAASTAPGVLSVGASTANDTLASFSSYGSWVQVAAPGEHIVSTVPGGGYASWTGTSMATPFGAGIAALVRATAPSSRPNEVVMRAKTTATTIDSPVRRRIDAAGAVGAGN